MMSRKQPESFPVCRKVEQHSLVILVLYSSFSHREKQKLFFAFAILRRVHSSVFCGQGHARGVECVRQDFGTVVRLPLSFSWCGSESLAQWIILFWVSVGLWMSVVCYGIQLTEYHCGVVNELPPVVCCQVTGENNFSMLLFQQTR